MDQPLNQATLTRNSNRQNLTNRGEGGVGVPWCACGQAGTTPKSAKNGLFWASGTGARCTLPWCGRPRLRIQPDPTLMHRLKDLCLIPPQSGEKTNSVALNLSPPSFSPAATHTPDIEELPCSSETAASHKREGDVLLCLVGPERTKTNPILQRSLQWMGNSKQNQNR